MVAIKAHYDGKVIIPDEPVDLPRNKALVVQIEVRGSARPTKKRSALDLIGDNAVDDKTLPADLSMNHDHYLYGRPKKKRA